MDSVYVTTAKVGVGGGGTVAFHESKALANVSNLVKVWSSPAFENPFLSDYFALCELEDLKVDVAHFNGNPFGVTAHKLKEKGAKVFVTVPAHNLEESIREFERWGISYPHRHMTDPYLWKLYTRHIVEADMMICPSRLSADYIEQKLNLSNQIVVIPHGTDLPSEVPDYPEVFTVGHVGVNGPDKGQIYLIHAWKLFQEKNRKNLYIPPTISFPNSLWLSFKQDNLMLAGSGTEAWGGLGYIKDPTEVYRKCTVYVQPTVTEGFGIPVLEAMAFGRPVVVTEGCGACELVEDGTEGFVVPVRSPEALAKKIRFCSENPDEVKRMGRNARVKAEKYEWSKIEKRYEELYDTSVYS